jgi:cleavage and polyadenylation specificity factor subunit 2
VSSTHHGQNRRLKIVKTLDEVNALPGPKLVLASFPSLDTGFAATLFRSWSTDPLNTLILPDKGPTGSLCRTLYDSWVSKVENGLAQDQIRAPVALDMELQLDVIMIFIFGMYKRQTNGSI